MWTEGWFLGVYGMKKGKMAWLGLQLGEHTWLQGLRERR